jgi:crotonobetainyl-CoA:carnitine CoA-transferase CaiB-like acyl-CoA transferase
MLVDLGAEVIKIESPDGGDYARWMPPLIEGKNGQSMGAYFHATNRNKKSVLLNLKSEAGQAALHRLAQTADVLVEGFRPGVTARLSCDYETLKAINPRLVYCSISGWGQTGAYSQISAHDLNYVGRAGMISEMNHPQPMGGQVADVGGAYVAVAGILAALLRREKTGEGGCVDASLFESALPFVSYAWVEGLMAKSESEQPRGVLSGKYACYNVYMTRDDQPVEVAALEEQFWANFCNAIERPDLIADYMTSERQKYLIAEITQVFALKMASEWDAILIPVDCCYTRVNDVGDLANDPHVQQRGLLDVDERGIPYLRSPIRMDGLESQQGSAPLYGEHTKQVLRDAGFTDSDIANLL